MTGKWLADLLSTTYPGLLKQINALDWTYLYTFSQNELWQRFINCVNALIGIFQHKQSQPLIENNIKAIHTTTQTVNFILHLYRLVLNTISNEVMGSLFSPILLNDMDQGAKYFFGTFNGRIKSLFEITIEINSLLATLEKQLSVENPMIRALSNAQRKKPIRFD